MPDTADLDRPDRRRGSSRQGAGYWLFAGHLLTVWGLALSNAFLGLTVLYAALRPSRTIRPLITVGRSGTARLLAPLAVYALVFLVSVAASYDVDRSLDELRDLLTLLTLPLALLLVGGESAVRRLVRSLIVLVTLLAVYGQVQYLVTDYGGLYRRIPGPFSHYMTFAGILLLGHCLLLARMTSRRERPPLREWIALALIDVTLVLTLTRSAWVAAVVAATLALWLAARRWLPLLLAALIVGALLLSWLAPQAWDRARSIVDPADPSNYDRLCMLYAGWHMTLERPLFGLGPGTVQELYPIYRHPTAPRLQVSHLHNTYAEMAAERGLLSLAAYLWLFLASGLAAWRGLRAEGGIRGPRSDLWLAVIVSLVAFSVAGLFEANWRDTEVQRWMLFLLALPLCLLRGESSGEASSVG
jgi:O-antigen ligase